MPITSSGGVGVASVGATPTFENVIVINGPNYTDTLRGQINMYNKCVMTSDLEVQGTIKTGGLSVITTGTGYIKNETYSTAQITTLLEALKTYTDTHLEMKTPLFTPVHPILLNLNLETGGVDLILDQTFIDTA